MSVSYTHLRGELGLGSAQAEQVELVDADDDGDQGDAQDGHVGVGAQQEALSLIHI